MAIGDMVSRDYLRHELDDLRSLMERIEAKLDDASADAIDSAGNLSEPIQGDVVDGQGEEQAPR